MKVDVKVNKAKVTMVEMTVGNDAFTKFTESKVHTSVTSEGSLFDVVHLTKSDIV